MRVVSIGSCLWTADMEVGTSTACRSMKGFEQAGHAVTAIFPTHDGTLPRRLECEGIEVRLVWVPLVAGADRSSRRGAAVSSGPCQPGGSRFRSTFFYLMYSWRAMCVAARICLREQVDLIYGLGCMGATPASLVGRLLRKPVVIRAFGTVLSPFDHIEWRWVKELPEFLQFRLPFDAMVMTNDGTSGDRAALGLGVKPERLFFWLEGVDKDELLDGRDASSLRRGLGIAEDEKVVVTMRLPGDGVRMDRTIYAFSRAAREMRGGVRLVIVGNGEERSRLEEVAKGSGSGKRILFVDCKDRSERGAYYSLADVMLCGPSPRLLSESVLEAMVCGKAVVVADGGGAREVCKNGENAVVVSAEETGGIGLAVADLLRDEGKRQRMGNRAREYAMEKIETWEQRVSREVGMAEELTRRFYLHVHPRSPKYSLLTGVIWPTIYR